MTELQIFKKEEFGSIRVIEKDNEPWFVAKDVAGALGYVDTINAVKQHCKGVVKYHLRSGGQIRQMSIIPEADLYRLILRSKLPSAEKFQDWVTEEVLPAIRKTGSYNLPDFNNPAEAARAWADMYEKRIAAEQKVIEMQPKAEYFDMLVDRKTLTNFRDTAKEFKIKQNKFINWLLDNEFIYRAGKKGELKPYSKFVENGLFELKEFTKEHKSGVQTLITAKGRETFRLLLNIDS